jgi:hypothetical protein
MIRHYAAEGSDLIFDHRHNAAMRYIGIIEGLADGPPLREREPLACNPRGSRASRRLAATAHRAWISITLRGRFAVTTRTRTRRSARLPLPEARRRAWSIKIILSRVASAGCLLELAGLLAGLPHVPRIVHCVSMRQDDDVDFLGQDASRSRSAVVLYVFVRQRGLRYKTH